MTDQRKAALAGGAQRAAQLASLQLQQLWKWCLAHKGIAAAIIGAIVVLIAVLEFRGGNTVQYLSAKVVRGDIHDVVEATGTINAVTTVQVGSQVSGTISKLNADFNSRVHIGQVIATIDPALFRGALQEAEADLENSKANVSAAKAELGKSRATLIQMKADYSRAEALIKANAASQQFYDQARANYEVAKAATDAASAAVNQAEAQVRQKAAAVAVAQANLDYTTIRSPIDGIVVARNVDVGQTVAASLQAPTIFTIAQDLTKMQVYAKTDESDVGRIRVGRHVTFKVDAFPKDVFDGVVSQIRMNATTVQNVVTYDTIIDFANPRMKLFPGMTAFVTIPVATAKDVLEVPNTALRFRPPLPPEEIRSLYARYGIDANGNPEGQRRSVHGESAVVWKLRRNGALEPVDVTIDITDHAYTQIVEVIKGELAEGDDIVTAAVVPKAAHP
ncbi:MAG: efflux RND transporter periplasmic adaptor subunit [Alphaproteobacteria bacterium]|nr:efflux RND transporter periplasmic adaptor subunit [Alphaproteobacteria bacterium]